MTADSQVTRDFFEMTTPEYPAGLDVEQLVAVTMSVAQYEAIASLLSPNVCVTSSQDVTWPGPIPNPVVLTDAELDEARRLTARYVERATERLADTYALLRRANDAHEPRDWSVCRVEGCSEPVRAVVEAVATVYDVTELLIDCSDDARLHCTAGHDQRALLSVDFDTVGVRDSYSITTVGDRDD